MAGGFAFYVLGLHFYCPSAKYMWSAASIIIVGAGDRSIKFLQYFYWIARHIRVYPYLHVVGISDSRGSLKSVPVLNFECKLIKLLADGIFLDFN